MYSSQSGDTAMELKSLLEISTQSEIEKEAITGRIA